MTTDTPAQTSTGPRRRAGRALTLGITGALVTVAVGLVSPTAALAVTGVTAPTLAGDPGAAIWGSAYDFAFTVTGQPAPTCRVSSGSLPTGLLLGASTCRLTGIPDSTGEYPFTVTASNGTAPDAVRSTSISVISQPGLATPTIPHATAGQQFSYQLPLTGYPAPTVEWSGNDPLPPGLALEPGGLLHGLPTQVGVYLNVGVRVSNAAGGTTYSLRITVDPQPPHITSGAPPDVLVGEPYSFRFTATGVPAPLFTIQPSTLPLGLDLDQASGVLSGTAFGLGDYPITVQASAEGYTDSRAYTLHVVGSAPQVHNTPPPATAGENYAFTFDTSGSAPAPRFTLESGTLPTGIILYSDGELQGRPGVIGAGSPVTVRASNGVGDDVLVTFTIPVGASPLTLTGTPPSPVAVGTDYRFAYTRTGIPASTTAVSGSLPPGLSLTETGYLSGRPTTPGTYTFTVTASNGGASDDVSITSTIVVTAPPTITGTPTPATVNQNYSFAFTVAGSPSTTVRLSAGRLPNGLALSTSGVLSGTPTEQGSFVFTVVADDGSQQGDWTTFVNVGGGSPTVVPGPASISVSDSRVTEGNSGARALTFSVSLTAARTSPVSVQWRTANGTATAPTDYYSTSGTLTFAPGQTSRTVTVWVRGDRRTEATETLHLRLIGVHGAAIADGDGLGRIVNDD